MHAQGCSDSSKIDSSDIVPDLDIQATKDRLTPLDVGGKFFDYFPAEQQPTVPHTFVDRLLRIGAKFRSIRSVFPTDCGVSWWTV